MDMVAKQGGAGFRIVWVEWFAPHNTIVEDRSIPYLRDAMSRADHIYMTTKPRKVTVFSNNNGDVVYERKHPVIKMAEQLELVSA